MLGEVFHFFLRTLESMYCTAQLVYAWNGLQSKSRHLFLASLKSDGRRRRMCRSWHYTVCLSIAVIPWWDQSTTGVRGHTHTHIQTHTHTHTHTHTSTHTRSRITEAHHTDTGTQTNRHMLTDVCNNQSVQTHIERTRPGCVYIHIYIHWVSVTPNT